MKRFALLFVVAAACGGSEKPAPVGPTTMGNEGMEHPKLTPELDAFHEAIAPRWHADKGEARMTDTCGAVPDFQAKAAAVKAAAAPDKVDATAWADAGAGLETAIAGLETACGGTDMPAFETAFEGVHDAFHHAMELVMPEGMEHEGMEHEGMEHEGMEHEGMEHH